MGRKKSMSCQYGAVLLINKDTLMKLLKLKGDIKGVEFNPLTDKLEISIAGDKKYFPAIEEACEAEKVVSEVTLNSDREIIESALVDSNNKRYIHFRKEKPCNGKEDSKKKENCEGEVNIYGVFRNPCSKHPTGYCPRAKGDCVECRWE